MIRINLLPVKELRAEVSRRREIVLTIACFTITVIGVLGLYAYQLHQKTQLETELAGLRSELQDLTVKAKGVAVLQSRIKEFEGKHKVIEDINRKKSGPVKIMENLSASTPTALWLTQFKEIAGDVTITGVAMDNQTIAEFLKSLATHANFRETELIETAQTEQKGLPPRRFLIKSRLLYQLPIQSVPSNKPNVLPAKAN